MCKALSMYTYIHDDLLLCSCGNEECCCLFYQKASGIQDTILGTLDSRGDPTYQLGIVHVCCNTQAYLSCLLISTFFQRPSHARSKQLRHPAELRVSTFSG